MLTKRNDEVILPLPTISLVEAFVIEDHYLIFVVHNTLFSEESITILIDAADYNVFESQEFKDAHPLAIVEYPVCFRSKAEFEKYAKGHAILSKLKLTWEKLDLNLKKNVFQKERVVF